jgi:hypothetical protein
MPASQLVFFIGWLAVALAGGAALYFGWQRWYRMHGPR